MEEYRVVKVLIFLKVFLLYMTISSSLQAVEMCPFRTAYINTDSQYIGPIIMGGSALDTEQIESLVLILEFDDIEFIIAENKVFVTCRLYQDMSSFLSYTVQLKDERFLDSLRELKKKRDSLELGN